ncbi:hypothetical protein AB0I60_35510 [Actinosynnema sp. NPDC050436]|uniref:hypothetical protein n=1 Tax=Actinosynnema sp. NPDC050436 TaxID=3155659 RepID=UPI0033F7D66D
MNVLNRLRHRFNAFNSETVRKVARNLTSGSTEAPPREKRGVMAKRSRTLLEDMFDRLDDAGRDLRRAGRRTFKAKKKNSGSRKWAKRNNQQLELLTEQISFLVKHLSAGTKDGARKAGPETGKS